MQIISEKNLEKISLPLPIYETMHIADAIGKDGEKFSLLVGLDKNLALQLKTRSLDLNDIELQKNTSDFKRFGVGSYEDWYKKNRTPFALVHNDTGILTTIIWFGPEPLISDENNWHTVAWRSYIPFRGKGLMKDFSNFAMNFYLKYFPNIHLWISLKNGNIGSQELASRLGFQILKEKSDDVSCVMVKNQ